MENMNGYDILVIQIVTTVYNLKQFGIKITTSPSYKINPDHVFVHVEKH
jgi:Ni,Fe-hydrogenase III small subunit